MAWWSRKKEKKEAAEALAEKRSVPSGLWQKCDECGAILESQKVMLASMVCPACGNHFPIGTDARMGLIMDEGTFEEFDAELEPQDRLGFRDTKRYADRLKAAARQIGPGDAFRDGIARIDGEEVAVGFFVFEFMGGSMGSVVGEKIARQFERARERRVPAIVFSASGGARMQEGILSLMQMAKTTAALARLRASGVPYISVLLHPTTGGVAASFAMLGDVIIAEPRALIGFAGPRVIEQTIRQKLPAGFQRSEFLLQHGMLDAIVDRREMKSWLARLVRLLRPVPALIAAAEPRVAASRPAELFEAARALGDTVVSVPRAEARAASLLGHSPVPAPAPAPAPAVVAAGAALDPPSPEVPPTPLGERAPRRGNGAGRRLEH